MSGEAWKYPNDYYTWEYTDRATANAAFAGVYAAIDKARRGPAPADGLALVRRQYEAMYEKAARASLRAERACARVAKAARAGAKVAAGEGLFGPDLIAADEAAVARRKVDATREWCDLCSMCMVRARLALARHTKGAPLTADECRWAAFNEKPPVYDPDWLP